MIFVEVVVPLKLREMLYWHIPDSWASQVAVGGLVSVPLQHKTLFGFVFSISESPPPYATKPITATYGQEQFSLSQEQMNLWRWLADYYGTSLGELMFYAYPSLCMPEQNKYKASPRIEDTIFAQLSSEEERVLRYLLYKKIALTEKYLQDKLRIARLASILDSLEQRGLCMPTSPKLSARKKQSSPATPAPPNVLSPAQQKALEEINAFHFTQKQQVVLLYGVTGSGKTNLYVEMIRQVVVHEGKQVLFLIPEIFLADQIFHRLHSFFGDQVAVYHSKISHLKRQAIWWNIKAGTPMVIIGTMSSVFLPFSTLSLVIVDEEHDTSYKQQNPPFYHSRDVGIVLATFHQARVLLGSATPSLETYYNAKIGKYGCVHLKHKYSQIPAPKVNVFDLKSFLGKQKPSLWIGPPVKRAIDEALSNNDQVLIFQNRRGYAPYTLCTHCGHIPTCHQCNANLVYHKDRNLFICHHCDSQFTLSHCLSCLQPNTFSFCRAGTQRVEEEMRICYPHEKIYVLDKDTSKKKSYVKEALEEYARRSYRLLIGTQLVTKGFDFGHLQLIVVPDFDMFLQFNGFRNNERIMQQMEQVAGRAGRTQAQGTIWIQTHHPSYPLLTYLKEHNYSGFLEEELRVRQQFSYPPFVKMVDVVCSGRNQNEVYEVAKELANTIRNTDASIGTSAPIEMPVFKVRNKFSYRVVMKCSTQKSHYISQKSHIFNALAHAKIRYRKVELSLNVDPQ